MAPVTAHVQKFPASADLDAIIKAFREDGCVIIKGLLSQDQVRRFNEEIQPSMDEIPTLVTEDGSSNDRVKRFSKAVTTSPTFRHEILEIDLLHQLCNRIYSQKGEGMGYHFNDTQVIEIQPGGPAQHLHRDNELFPWWNSMGPSAPDAVMNYFCALSPFTAENGATRIVLGSHRWPKFTLISPEHCEEYDTIETIPALMDPGDCYLMTGKLVHGGGHNSTSTEQRRALALSIIRRELRPVQAFPMWVPLDVARQLSPRSQVMFGFRSSTQIRDVDSVHFWGNNGQDVAEHLGLNVAA
ncbi:hypothetical protein BJX70DRAFT_384818 [Aspergillus crustosus]